MAHDKIKGRLPKHPSSQGETSPQSAAKTGLPLFLGKHCARCTLAKNCPHYPKSHGECQA